MTAEQRAAGNDHLLAALESGASFSPCQLWRYTLRRRWLTGDGEVAWICLNPSTADHTKNDPTVRRTIGYAKLWGFQATWMLNAFAWRDTDPKQLKVQIAAGTNVVGVDNDAAILAVAGRVKRIVLAWGNHGEIQGRAAEVVRLLRPFWSKCSRLGDLTGEGFPRHPLYVANDIRLRPFDPFEGPAAAVLLTSTENATQ